ncbi:hydrogenase maturation protease [Methylocystis sp. WRRC1]|uniref:hydrogenase maturation protease n=1 Tax=Methylocystis sp. WRRC1 TaxID=1732014 RepID=UPI001D147923|nr:hydrogenase maturation protease [Methylocystis sp. WRRC1]MCC3244559.1 hydrogenase maturation protease [Methylocystis sp. WRRC1]
MPSEASSIIVIGIGNPDRGDDAAGREVARRLCETIREGVQIVEIDGEATTLLAHLEGAHAAFMIDACVSGATPGAILRLDASETQIPRARFGLSSHGVGLAEALELARALGQMPPQCIVYAIEAENFEIGAPLSSAVARSVDQVVAGLGAEIAALRRKLITG